jgi:hypothetical protein
MKYSIGSPSGKKSTSSSPAKPAAESSRQQEIDDLDLAIQLSLVETHAHTQDLDTADHQEEEFPTLPEASRSPGSGKNKGKTRMVW